MKSIISICVITALIVGGSIWEIASLTEISERMQTATQEVGRGVSDKNFDEAQRSYEKLEAVWNEVSPTLLVLIHHSDIDEISRLIPQVGAYIGEREAAGGLAALNELNVLSGQIIVTAKIDAANIF